MARKGELAPGKKLVAMTDRGAPRCQFVKAPVKGKKYGEQCKNPCVSGRQRCRNHGGKAGRPPTTHRYSKLHPVPRNLTVGFERALKDPEILNLSKQIALLDSQIWRIAEVASNKDDFNPVEMKGLVSLMKNQRELIGQETQRRVSLGGMVEVQQVMVILKYVYDSVCRHVQDPLVRSRIGVEIRKIVGSSSADTVIEGKVVGRST